MVLIMDSLWYEKEADRKEHLLFMRRNFREDVPTSGLPHIHNSVELVFGIKGASIVGVGDKYYEACPGRMIFINHFEPHTYQYKADSEFYVVVISSSFFDGANELKELFFPSVNEYCDGFVQIKNFLDISYMFRDVDSMSFKTGFVNMLVSILKSIYPHGHNSEGARINDVLLSTIKYVGEHCREDISVGSIAEKFGYSPNYLSTVFNKYMGMNFREYLNRCRLSEYIKLKKKSPDSAVWKLASQCGFYNMSTFYRALKSLQADSNIEDWEF